MLIYSSQKRQDQAKWL